ncbi:hypothetical protein KKB10_02450 [Patescibacteria group bacterium]|nr:hypothetical protein [Patescibacteria group bacterium]MBU1951338.1 hypothetical protein [Patescibacteria group bacterium]
MKSINKILVYIFLVSLVVLVGIELSINYDAFDRRVALSATAIFAGVTFLVVDKVVRKKHQLSLPWFVALAVVFSVWLDAIGNFWYLYTKFSWWDDLAHFAGSLSVAVLVYSIFLILREKKTITLSNFHFSTYVFSVAVLVTIFYELTEYFGDLLFEMQRVGARYDTSSDLTYDVLGALVVVLVGNRISKKSNQS